MRTLREVLTDEEEEGRARQSLSCSALMALGRPPPLTSFPACDVDVVVVVVAAAGRARPLPLFSLVLLERRLLVDLVESAERVVAFEVCRLWEEA